MAKKDVTQLIQRLEALENRLGVRIEAVSAFESDSYEEGEVEIEVRGELHAVGGSQITSEHVSGNITIRLNAYDSKGRLIDSQCEFIDTDNFYGFHVIDLSCSANKGLITSLRLFPEAS